MNPPRRPRVTVVITRPDGRKEVWEDGKLVQTIPPPGSGPWTR